MREIEIWRFETDCYDCDSTIQVVYPRKVDGSGKQWDLVGEQLTDKDYCNIQHTYSKTRDKHIYGNICPECGAYQGNHFIHEIVFSDVAAFQSWERARDRYEVVDVIEADNAGESE